MGRRAMMAPSISRRNYRSRAAEQYSNIIAEHLDATFLSLLPLQRSQFVTFNQQMCKKAKERRVACGSVKMWALAPCGVSTKHSAVSQTYQSLGQLSFDKRLV